MTVMVGTHDEVETNALRRVEIAKTLLDGAELKLRCFDSSHQFVDLSVSRESLDSQRRALVAEINEYSRDLNDALAFWSALKINIRRRN